MQTKQVIVTEGDEVVYADEHRLYTFAELKALDGEDEIDQRAVQNASEWLSTVLAEIWDGDSEVDYLCSEILPLTGIDVDREYGRNQAGERIPTGWKVEWSVGDRGEHFTVTHCSIDTEKFLAALGRWARNEDIRGKEYSGAKDYGTLAAGPRYTWRLDKRRKEVAIVREQGLTLHVINGMRRRYSDEVDWDYQYEGVSAEFKEAANELVSDLMGHCLKVLRDDWENTWDDEEIAGFAEANEYTFNKHGKRED
jgi:hypothetical protein